MDARTSSGFLDELEKIAASIARFKMGKSRAGRRPISVANFLRKEKAGTLYKEGAPANTMIPPSSSTAQAAGAVAMPAYRAPTGTSEEHVQRYLADHAANSKRLAALDGIIAGPAPQGIRALPGNSRMSLPTMRVPMAAEGAAASEVHALGDGAGKLLRRAGGLLTHHG